MTTFKWSQVTFEAWLASLHERAATPASRAVLAVLMQQPERATHASTQVIADAAGVNIASVTRAAQALGYTGWPQLRDEVRMRYMSSISSPEFVGAFSTTEAVGAFERSIDTDLRSAARTVRGIEAERIDRIVADVAGARIRLALGAGLYSALAEQLAMRATLSGYDTDAPAEGTATANAVARLSSADVVVAFGFWRLHENTIVAVQGAKSRGARVHVFTDQATTPLTEAADEVVLLSAEGSGFFPSLTAPMAVVSAVCAELAAIDPARTAASLRLAEVEWSRSKLLRR